MKFIRQHPVFIALLAVFLILFGGSVALLTKTMSKRTEVEAELNAQRERRASLWGRKPFPSKPNVEVVQRNAQEMKTLVDGLLATFLGPSIDVTPLEGLEAKQRILVRCRQMSEALAKAEVKHPEKFQFGFDRYATYPPKKEDTPLLFKQLSITEELVRILTVARIHDLTAVRRVEFEDLLAAGTKAPNAYDPKSEPLISMNGKFEFVDQPNYLYSTMPFDLEFICDTEALRKMLMALSRSPYILVPRIITVENEKKEPMSAAGATRAGPTGDRPGFFTPPMPTPAPAAPVRGARKTAVEPAKPFAQVDITKIRPVMGEERIKVGIRLEWLDFRHAEMARPAVERKKEKGGGH